MRFRFSLFAASELPAHGQSSTKEAYGQSSTKEASTEERLVHMSPYVAYTNPFINSSMFICMSVQVGQLIIPNRGNDINHFSIDFWVSSQQVFLNYSSVTTVAWHTVVTRSSLDARLTLECPGNLNTAVWRIKYFASTLRRRNSKTFQSPVYEETRSRRSHNRDAIVFENPRF